MMGSPHDYQPRHMLHGLGYFIDCIEKLPDGEATFISAMSTLVAGTFVIFAAYLAWRSVQNQISSAEKIELSRYLHEQVSIETGFLFELLAYSRGVIQGTSFWNNRVNAKSEKVIASEWPFFIEPMYYKANVGKIGYVRKNSAVGPMITFYAHILELNEQVKDFLAGKPVPERTVQIISRRMRVIAASLAEALNGLSREHDFSISSDIILEKLFSPNGMRLDQLDDVPKTIPEVLSTLASNFQLPKI